MTMIDHVGMTVSNYEKSKAFYTQVLRPLNIKLIIEQGGWAGFGKKDKPEFWFGPAPKIQPLTHIAFQAETHEAIDNFYDIAIRNGAICNGKPKRRDLYYLNYYSAFIIDHDGHHIGSVLHHSNNN